ncbi:MAG: hypothetical protein IH991_12345 [Planctomycetes bacterium]|nr:hypothetical protein [Planctomycetota bacterium]
MNSVTVKTRFHMSRQYKSRKQMKHGKEPIVSEGAPRISRLMALAIHFDQLVRDCVVADFAELAQLGHVTRARLTQITNLLNLAPDVQEELLFLEHGREVTERRLRPILAEADWGKQRVRWERLKR